MSENVTVAPVEPVVEETKKPRFTKKKIALIAASALAVVGIGTLIFRGGSDSEDLLVVTDTNETFDDVVTTDV